MAGAKHNVPQPLFVIPCAALASRDRQGAGLLSARLHRHAVCYLCVTCPKRYLTAMMSHGFAVAPKHGVADIRQQLYNSLSLARSHTAKHDKTK
jgi:hypothetical protein